MNDRRALVYIFCTVTLDVLAVGVMVPVLPTLVLSFMGGDTAGAAEVIGVFATVWGLMQFLCSPLLGALSDRYGRRPVILISCLGLGLDYIFMAVAPSLTLLFVGRIISGITSATLSTAFAYITDVTPPDGRAKAFGIVGIAFGLGFIVGPATGGLLGGLDPRLPFWVSATACLANATFGWFVLPESLPPERRMPFTWKRASPVGSLNLLRSSHQLLGLAAFVGICSAIVQGLLIGPFVTWFGKRRALIGCLLLGGLSMTIYGLAPSGAWFWAGVPLMALWGIAGAVTQDLMAQMVSPAEQGQLQGANNSSRSIAGLIGPGIFAAIFAHLLDQEPCAPFLLAALLLVVAAGVSGVVTASLPTGDQRP